MRLASSPDAARFRRGQAIYPFLLGLAMVALLLANVFLFLEYFGYFHGRNDVLAEAEAAISESESELRAFQQRIQDQREEEAPESPE